MTTDQPQTIPLGEAKVSILNFGHLLVSLAEWLKVPEAEWPARHAADFRQKILVPIQCLHIALPGASMLVDACHPEAMTESDSAPPDYQPPASLFDQLAAVGASPESITHVIITHTHWDHYCGLIRLQDGPDTLSFPRAKHYVGGGDWSQAQTQLDKPDSMENRTLGLAYRQGLLEPVEGETDLVNGVRIIPAPGETTGHQIARVESGGQVLYALGDLYHHPVEAERPDWMVHWSNAATNRVSKAHLAEAALAEDARLVATHIYGVGRLRRTADGVVWEAV